MKTQGERLRQARVEAGYSSAREAATAHGWVVSTYTAHENGQNGLSTNAAQKYAEAFKTKADWLLLGNAAMGPELNGIEDQLRKLPPEAAKELVLKFNSMIEGVRIALKIK